jgi:hypothetical protein
MDFRLHSNISNIETIARGKGVRERRRLSRLYGHGRWLKRKGYAEVCLDNGAIVLAEVHWYEAHGIGRREFKLKRVLSANLYD